MRLLCAAVVLGLFMVGGCATIVTGTTQPITITSEPTGATVTVGGNRLITPATVELSRKHDATIVVEKEGYEAQQIVLKRKLQGWTFGNILLGGPVGLVVDAVSGGLVAFKQDTVFFDLEPVGKTPEQVAIPPDSRPPADEPSGPR